MTRPKKDNSTEPVLEHWWAPSDLSRLLMPTIQQCKDNPKLYKDDIYTAWKNGHPNFPWKCEPLPGPLNNLENQAASRVRQYLYNLPEGPQREERRPFCVKALGAVRMAVLAFREMLKCPCYEKEFDFDHGAWPGLEERRRGDCGDSVNHAC